MQTFTVIPQDKKFDLALRKHQTIRALKMDAPFAVVTLEGTMNGKAGDYLAVGIKGEMYVIDQEIFKDLYSIVEDQAEYLDESGNYLFVRDVVQKVKERSTQEATPK